jgi:hypothetical protein
MIGFEKSCMMKAAFRALKLRGFLLNLRNFDWSFGEPRNPRRRTQRICLQNPLIQGKHAANRIHA